jgi:hypothetical protein
MANHFMATGGIIALGRQAPVRNYYELLQLPTLARTIVQMNRQGIPGRGLLIGDTSTRDGHCSPFHP